MNLNIPNVNEILAKHKVDPWHHYIINDRDNRWEVRAIVEWVKTNIKKDAVILSLGCGMGFNLFEWAEDGFTNLWGMDRDPKTIAAAQELNSKIMFWQGDIRYGFWESKPDYIDALNCLMYDKECYERFFENYVKQAKQGCVIALDIIEPYGDCSTYKVQLSREDVSILAEKYGLKMEALFCEPQPIIRTLYIFTKQ